MRHLSILRNLLLAMLMLLGLPVGGAEVMEPPDQQTVVMPVAPGLQAIDVQVWTSRSRYRVGEDVAISLRVSRTAHVYVFSTDGSGITRQIFPNAYDQEHQLRAGQTLRLPRSDYRLVASAPGWDTIQVVAVGGHPAWRPPLYFGEPRAGEPFPMVGGGVDRARAELKSSMEQQAPTPDTAPRQGITPRTARRDGTFGAPQTRRLAPQPQLIAEEPTPPRPLPGQAWGEAETRFYVERAPQYYGDEDHWIDPPDGEDMGTLRVTSQPSGADVYLDGQLVGRTPLRVEVPAQTYQVELFLSGWDVFRNERVRVLEGRTRTLNVRMRR